MKKTTRLATNDNQFSLPIKIKDLTKTYDDVFALNRVSLDVEAGEFLTLLGPSGSGKTTLLMAIAGFSRPTAGSICFGEKEMVLTPPHRREVGMVFQNYALFPHMTVAENLSFPLEVRKLEKSLREEKVERALNMVEMGGFKGRRPAQLSGGQQQRIALARALVFEPELVLMDEPLGALDKQLREKMQFEITALAHRLGITVVYVTHDQTEALTMSDRVAVFNDGRIQQLATPDQLYEEPENSFVAQFIGENNTLNGTVKGLKNDIAKVELDSGDIIDCKPVNVSGIGERTQVSIRPERVELNKKKLPAGAHTINAEVLEFIYMGDIFRTRLKVAGNEDFIVKTRNSSDQVRLKPGEKVEIGWSPECCRALDA